MSLNPTLPTLMLLIAASGCAPKLSSIIEEGGAGIYAVENHKESLLPYFIFDRNEYGVHTLVIASDSRREVLYSLHSIYPPVSDQETEEEKCLVSSSDRFNAVSLCDGKIAPLNSGEIIEITLSKGSPGKRKPFRVIARRVSPTDFKTLLFEDRRIDSHDLAYLADLSTNKESFPVSGNPRKVEEIQLRFKRLAGICQKIWKQSCYSAYLEWEKTLQ